MPWHPTVPATPASFRALRTNEEASKEWSDERRLDLILSIVIGEMGLREAAALTGVAKERILEWKEELLFDGRAPWNDDDDDDDDLGSTFVLVT